MLFDHSNIKLDVLHNNLFVKKGITLSVVRLDNIHPVISGNKLFKLHYFLDECLLSTHKKIVTFGGAYSNHLAATAYACKITGLKSIGIVRGDEPASLSHTLQSCVDNGMHLKFISRDEYSKKEEAYFLEKIKNELGDCIIIPEGGYSTAGAKGASLIMDLVPETATHICCALGTATTVAGLLLKSKPHQEIISVAALKGMIDIDKRVSFLTENKIYSGQLKNFTEYHFGGYAKYTPQLISFMNELYEQYTLPTDFVYTAKMFFAIFDNIIENTFKPGSNIIAIHTGGVQGNASLPHHSLIFD